MLGLKNISSLLVLLTRLTKSLNSKIFLAHGNPLVPTCSSLNPLNDVCRWNMILAPDDADAERSTFACGRAMANGFSSFSELPSPADGNGGGVADGLRLCGSCGK